MWQLPGGGRGGVPQMTLIVQPANDYQEGPKG